MTLKQSMHIGLLSDIAFLNRLVEIGHSSSSPLYQDVHSTIQRRIFALGGLAGRW